MSTAPKPVCQTCRHHSQGVAVILESGTNWCWQECTKSWGKPTPIGVIKNVCNLWVKKNESNLV